MSDQKPGEERDDDEPTKIRQVPAAVSRAIETSNASLVVVSVPFDSPVLGAELGRRIPIGRAVSIGRQAGNSLVLEHDEVSRKHAEVFVDDGKVRIRDLGSRNGTLVNDQDLAGQIRTLMDGDRITVGTVILKFIQSDAENEFHEVIYRLKVEDALTGAHNKRFLTEFLERELARSARHKGPLSLVMYDLDHFKKVNDTHGHLAGDMVLRESAALVKALMRREDCYARYGGEEFCLVLPEISLENAAILAEKIRAKVEAAKFEFNGVRIPVTVSLGVVQLPDGLKDAANLIALADACLYKAKREGRNRVVTG